MTKFEINGVEKLMNCLTADQIEKSYAKSCELCSEWGRCKDCEQCAIKYHYEICKFSRSFIDNASKKDKD